jgi:hypothetical protein
MAGHIVYMAKRRKEQEVLVTIPERQSSTLMTYA